MCLKNLTIVIMITIIWINFGVILIGYNYSCFLSTESITNRLHFGYLAVIHGSLVFSIKRRNLYKLSKILVFIQICKIIWKFLIYDFDFNKPFLL